MNKVINTIYDTLLVIAIFIILYILISKALKIKSDFPSILPGPEPEPSPIIPPGPNPFPGDSRYNCLNGNCYKDPRGSFLNLNDCKYACTKTTCKKKGENCNNLLKQSCCSDLYCKLNSNYLGGNGICTPYGPSPGPDSKSKYKCVIGTCIQDSAGEYSSKEECSLNCKPAVEPPTGHGPFPPGPFPPGPFPPGPDPGPPSPPKQKYTCVKDSEDGYHYCQLDPKGKYDTYDKCREKCYHHHHHPPGPSPGPSPSPKPPSPKPPSPKPPSPKPPSPKPPSPKPPSPPPPPPPGPLPPTSSKYSHNIVLNNESKYAVYAYIQAGTQTPQNPVIIQTAQDNIATSLTPNNIVVTPVDNPDKLQSGLATSSLTQCISKPGQKSANIIAIFKMPKKSMIKINMKKGSTWPSGVIYFSHTNLIMTGGPRGTKLEFTITPTLINFDISVVDGADADVTMEYTKGGTPIPTAPASTSSQPGSSSVNFPPSVCPDPWPGEVPTGFTPCSPNPSPPSPPPPAPNLKMPLPVSFHAPAVTPTMPCSPDGTSPDGTHMCKPTWPSNPWPSLMKGKTRWQSWNWLIPSPSPKKSIFPQGKDGGVYPKCSDLSLSFQQKTEVDKCAMAGTTPYYCAFSGGCSSQPFSLAADLLVSNKYPHNCPEHGGGACWANEGGTTTSTCNKLIKNFPTSTTPAAIKNRLKYVDDHGTYSSTPSPGTQPVIIADKFGIQMNPPSSTISMCPIAKTDSNDAKDPCIGIGKGIQMNSKYSDLNLKEQCCLAACPALAFPNCQQPASPPSPKTSAPSPSFNCPAVCTDPVCKSAPGPNCTDPTKCTGYVNEGYKKLQCRQYMNQLSTQLESGASSSKYANWVYNNECEAYTWAYGEVQCKTSSCTGTLTKTQADRSSGLGPIGSLVITLHDMLSPSPPTPTPPVSTSSCSAPPI